LRAVLSVFSEEKKLSIAALSPKKAAAHFAKESM
jgi:hypothetical protein